MGFKDLKLLTTKEYRIYLILTIWLIIGFTFNQFEATAIVGFIILIPLVILSFILVIIAFFSRKKFEEMSRKRIIISIIIIILFGLVFINFFLGVLFYLFLLAVISYILITTLFTMNYFYKWGIKIDDYLYKLPKSIKKFERKSIFVGGTALSIAALIIASIIAELITGGTGRNIGFNTSVVAIVIIIIIIILAIISIIISKRGKLNAWIGIFFVWISIYAIFLMFSIINNAFSDSGGTNSSIPVQIGLYFFNLLLLLLTISNLISERAEVLKQKMRFFDKDTILTWLIFSLASLEFASGDLVAAEVDLIRYIMIYLLFIPLTFIFGIYGIRSYNKIYEKRKIKDLEKEAKREGVITEEQILCSSCGAINEKNAQFCKECGAKLN